MTQWLLPFIWSVSLAATASAQTHPKRCAPNDSKSCVQPLLEGELAPFSGQLLTYRRAVILGVKAEQCQIAVNEAQELASIDLRLEQDLRKNDHTHAQLQLDLVLRKLEDAESRAVRRWFEHPALWTTVGVITTTAIFYGAIQVVDQAVR